MEAVREWALKLDGVEPARAVADAGRAPARRAADARGPRAPLARGAAAARRDARDRAGRRARAALGAASLGRHLRSARARLDARHVRGAGAGRRRRADRRRHAAGRRRARRRRGARRSASTRCGRSAAPQAIAWLAYVERVDRIVGPGNAYVNEAKLAVSRDVAIDLPAGPSEVVVLASNGADPRIVELELAAQAEHGPDSVCRVVDTLAEAEALAPEHLVLLGAEAEALAPRGPQRGRGLRRRVVAGRRGRLRDGRQPRSADRRLGAQRRRPRARDVPQAGDDPAPDRRRGSRACGRSSRRSRRSRACPRTPRRCGDESALARSSPATAGRRRPRRSRGSPGSTRSRSSASTATSPHAPLPSSRPGAIAGALARINTYRARRLPGAAATRSRGTRASRRRTSCSAPAPTT